MAAEEAKTSMSGDEAHHRMRAIGNEIMSLFIKAAETQSLASHGRTGRDLSSSREVLHIRLEIGQLVQEWQRLRRHVGLPYGLGVLADEVGRTESYLSQHARFADAEPMTVEVCLLEGLDWQQIQTRISRRSRAQLEADIGGDPEPI